MSSLESSSSASSPEPFTMPDTKQTRNNRTAIRTQTKVIAMTRMKTFALIVLSASSAAAFSPSNHPRLAIVSTPRRSTLCTASSYLSSAAASVASPNDESSFASDNKTLTKQQKRNEQIKKDGGILAFNTKYGALNPFAIYYGLTSITLGLVWFAALTCCQILYKVTGDRVDRRRRIPVFLSHVWGTLLMLFTGCFPKIENGDIIKKFHERYVR